ncbi:two-component system, OmpR family, response regulator VanR [Enterococcus sp. AZ194]|uniref:response regulator transcription factor n=1 Tax=Enterococcus sp. AZ194 TaxID=2774629 RepID=UPI003F2502CA
MNARLLLVEDDLSIQKVMLTFLQKEGYRVTAVSDGQSAIDLFQQESFELIILDMMLPKKSGEEVLREIRQSSQQPIMIISALNDEMTQIGAYTNQIEDYVVKPFSMNILLFKISAILKRIYGDTNQRIQLGDVTMFVEQYEVKKAEQLVVLTTKEFEILLAMAQNKGKVYSREELLTLVWGYDFLGDSRTIDVHVKNIRQKLGSELIKTIKGVGYKVEK